jgi:hypothetical protein
MSTCRSLSGMMSLLQSMPNALHDACQHLLQSGIGTEPHPGQCQLHWQCQGLPLCLSLHLCVSWTHQAGLVELYVGVMTAPTPTQNGSSSFMLA